MIQKVILTPENCGRLMPHWHELDDEKLERLSRLMTRASRFDHSVSVMSAPPIIVVAGEGYIVNGKHRASKAYLGNYNIEACLVRTSSDLRFHTPQVCFGSHGLNKMLESFDNRATYISHCRREGIYSVADLVKKHFASGETEQMRS